MNSNLVCFKASSALINEGAEDDAFDLERILKAKYRVENASMTDNTVKSIHAEALATEDL